MKRIYSRDFHPMTDIEGHLFNEFLRTFNTAADEGFSKSVDPDDDFREAIRHSNAVFSAFKTHRMQNDMAARLLDENGDLKPFEQWKKDVRSIASHQCGAWLRTEYDTAVIRARQAADWKQFERERDVLPNLKWLPSTSLHPGEDHRPFWGTILPIDHPFWSKHRPGDRWNCKCDLTSTDEPPTRVPGETEKDNPHRGLDNNPGKDAALFSDSHPYYPSDCQHCAFYRPSRRAYLRTFFENRAKDCYNCPYIDGCIDGVTKVNHKVAEHVKEIKKQLDQYQGAIVKDKNYVTGQIRLLRRSLTDIIEHDREDAGLMQWLSSFTLDDLKGWDYEGWAQNRPYEPSHPKYNPHNPKMLKHPETYYFLYYSKTINGKKYWANVKMHRDYNGEVLYTIEPKEPEDIIKGMPQK